MITSSRLDSRYFPTQFIAKWVVIFLCMSAPALGQAESSGDDGVYTVIVKKQEQKKQQRWSLASWYETKEKIRLMDMWLALHTSYSLYEFFIGGDTATLALRDPQGTTDSVERVIQRAEIGGYASIFGLQAQYIDLAQTETGWDASFHFRLLGTAVQNTNLTLTYGIRHRKEAASTSEFHNHFAGVSMTLYLHKVLGIEGLYKSYFPNTTKKDQTLDGGRTEVSLFLDYSLLRIYATWFEESLSYFDDSTQTSRTIRNGILGGLKVFF